MDLQMISISDTMANIRYLLDKHCKGIENSNGAPMLPTRKTNKYNKPIQIEKAFEIAKELDEGLDLNEAVIRFNYTKQTLWNIKNRRQRFSIIPYENIGNDKQNSTSPISSTTTDWQCS
jgi:hypothetical protein